MFWRKISIEGKTKRICPQFKLIVKCLFSLTAGWQWCTYCCLDPFLSKHPALQKTQPLCQDFCLQRAFVAMAISCSPGTQVVAPYHTYMNNIQTLISPWNKGISPFTTVPIFTCSNTRNQQYLTVHIEPELIQNKQLHPERGRAGWGWELSCIL